MQVPRKIEYIYSRNIISFNNINFLEICQFLNKGTGISTKKILLLKMCTFSNSQIILGWTVVNSKGSRDSCASGENCQDILEIRKSINTTESTNDSPKRSLDTHRKNVMILQPSDKCPRGFNINAYLPKIFRGRRYGFFESLNTREHVRGSAPSYQHYRHFVLHRTAMYKFSPCPANLQNK